MAMFVINGVIVSPETSDTVLDGVTRRSVLELAKDLRIPYEMRRLSVKELKESLENGSLTEAFGAGTAATIKPMSEIGVEGKRFKLTDAMAGKLFHGCLENWDGVRRGSIADDSIGIFRV